MKYQEITIETTEQSIEMISNFLHEMDAGGVSIEESGTLNKQRSTQYGVWYELPLNDIPEGHCVIKGYFIEDTNVDELTKQLKSSIDQLREFGIDPGDYIISVALVDEEDWANAWKQYFKPIRVTEKLTIKPTWEEYEASPGEQIIELDPGMAFGTGTHPTTSLCLKVLETVIQGDEEVIDVGTGSGILSIGARLLGAKSVLALDLDPVAVASAKENITLNKMDDSIEVHLSDLLGVLNNDNREQSAVVHKVSVPVDVVVANILAEIIVLFVKDVFDALKPGGTYIASGIYKDKGELVVNELTKHGFEIAAQHRDEDWFAIVGRKPQVIV